MKIVFTDHAKRRMRERNLSVRQVKGFITNPDTIEPSTKDPRRFLIKKSYYHRSLKRMHLAMMICEQKGSVLVVVTIIDTSKIAKYT